MPLLVQLVLGICAIINLVCFILVVVRMFQEGQTGLGVACIVLLFCFGIGVLVAFVVGWMNAGRWRINNVMMIWTVALVLHFVFSGLLFAVVPPDQRWFVRP